MCVCGCCVHATCVCVSVCLSVCVCVCVGVVCTVRVSVCAHSEWTSCTWRWRSCVSPSTIAVSSLCGNMALYHEISSRSIWNCDSTSTHSLYLESDALPAPPIDSIWVIVMVWMLGCKIVRIWWTLVQKRPMTVGEFLPTPKFSHWKTLPALPHGRYITDSRQTLARVM